MRIQVLLCNSSVNLEMLFNFFMSQVCYSKIEDKKNILLRVIEGCERTTSNKTSNTTWHIN